MNINQKIEQFSELIFKEAKEEQRKILNEISGRLETEIKRITRRAEEKAKQRINDELSKAVRERNKNVLNVTIESKKELLRLRDELQSQLFSEVQERLMLFVNSPQYEKWLIDSVMDCKADLDGAYAVVIVTQNDFKYKEKIEKISGYNVQVSEIDFFGGCRVLSEERKIVIDKTILNGYEEQKKLFNKIKISV